MKQYLKEYHVTLRTVGPVFVGSGREIGKKEYVFLNKNIVGIPDIQRLYRELQRRGKANAYEEFLLYNNKDNLTNWLRDQNINLIDIKPFINYSLACDNIVTEKGKRIQVMECIKDAYGNPYIPGTSIKGMLRTVLLAFDILQESGKYAADKKQISASLDDIRKANKNSYLQKETSQIEAKAYRTLRREDTRPNDAVNDCLQGLIVSDSEPLSTKDLVLCQSIEQHTDGTSSSLPQLRECIKPNTDVKFTITVDTQLCPWDDKSILKAVGAFAEQYYQNFAKAFKSVKKYEPNTVILGGNSGFVSKTVLYPLYGKRDGLEAAMKIFEKTGVSRAHKHYKDTEYGVSPHILKCTNYDGRTVQMGVCRISIQ